MRQIGWLINNQGQLEKYSSESRLSDDELDQTYRIGVHQTGEALKKLGFKEISDETPRGWHFQFKTLTFGFDLMNSSSVASVTSCKSYKPEHAGTLESMAIVSRLDEVCECKKVICVTTGIHSTVPIFILLEDGLEDPAQRIHDSVLNLVFLMAQSQHPLNELSQQRHLFPHARERLLE